MEYLVIALGGEENDVSSEIVIADALDAEVAMAAAIVGFFDQKFAVRASIAGLGDEPLAMKFWFPPEARGQEAVSPEDFARGARAFFAPFPDFAETFVAHFVHMDAPANRPPLVVPDEVVVHTWLNDTGIPLLVFRLDDIPRVRTGSS